MAWYVMRNEKTFGPLDNAQLKAMAAQGQVVADSQISQSTNGPWLPARNVRGLFQPPTPAPTDSSSSAFTPPPVEQLSGMHGNTAPVCPEPPSQNSHGSSSLDPKTGNILGTLVLIALGAIIFAQVVQIGLSAHHLKNLESLLQRCLVTVDSNISLQPMRLENLQKQLEQKYVFERSRERQRILDAEFERLVYVHAGGRALIKLYVLLERHDTKNKTEQHALASKPQHPSNAQAIGPFEAYKPFLLTFEQIRTAEIPSSRADLKELVFKSDLRDRDWSPFYSNNYTNERERVFDALSREVRDLSSKLESLASQYDVAVNMETLGYEIAAAQQTKDYPRWLY